MLHPISLTTATLLLSDALAALTGPILRFVRSGMGLSLRRLGFRRTFLRAIAPAQVLVAPRDGVVVLDQQGRITAVNPAAATLLGYRPAHVLGQPAAALPGGPLALALGRPAEVAWCGSVGLELCGAPPPAWADPELVCRILQSRVGNALAFTPAGGIVRVPVELWEADPAFRPVTVSDAGATFGFTLPAAASVHTGWSATQP